MNFFSRSKSPGPSNAGSGPRRRRNFGAFTYVLDWILTIIIIGAFYSLNNIHGFWREFSLTDESIQHTFATTERVPDWALYIIAFAVPLVLMPIVNVLSVRNLWDWHHSWLGLLLSLASTGAVTQVVKVTVGRPRPDLIDRCQPVAGAANRAVFGLVTSAICTQTDEHKLRDGFRSFFSGHSSLSFAGLGFLSWYLAGKTHLFDERGHTFKAYVTLVPLLGATLVAISRTMDYRHHATDVLIGSLVGLLFSYVAYRQYFPALGSPTAHLPFEPRHLQGVKGEEDHFRGTESEGHPEERHRLHPMGETRDAAQIA